MDKKTLLVLIACLFAAGLSGCSRSSYVGNNYTGYKVKQTVDNVHHLAMDGEQGEMPKGEEDISR